MERLRSMWFYYFAGFIFRNYLRLFFGLGVYGRENVPQSGGLVVASNHISWYDPPLVGCVLPREVRYMAKKELFEKQPMRWLAVALRSFPVDREGNDTGAIKEALRILRAEGAVGIFPEGTRYAELGQAFHGAAFLAQRAKAPLLPVALWREGRRFGIRFGEPIYPQGKSREEMVALTEELMRRVRAMIPRTASRPKGRRPSAQL